MVSLPSNTCYLDIEGVILHLLRLGVHRSELQDKVRRCNLVTWPSNMRGFSCSRCGNLDTNDLRVFSKHMREECGVRQREERPRYLISFCRCCHERFATRNDLEEHLDRDYDCWPDSATINRLYDSMTSARRRNKRPGLVMRRVTRKRRLSVLNRRNWTSSG